MIKILIGGSPCTHWSIAQHNDRETTAEGIGWKLFKNYLIAKEKFQPDFFLYENNKSAAQPIKDQISKELGVELMHINSALVSAQNRQRFYAHNIQNVFQPEDRGIFVKDILETDTSEQGYNLTGVCVAQRGRYTGANGKIEQHFEARNDGKTNTITTVQKDNLIAEPLKSISVGDIGSNSQAHRVYSADGKSVTIVSNGGGQGAKTGLYATPVCPNTEKKQIIYEVCNGLVMIKGKQHNINLADGYYLIRKLTVTECCRLQTMPDDYMRAVSASQGYKGLGNGWTAEVIKHILKSMNIPHDEEIVVLSMYDGIGTGRYCFDKLGYKNVKYYAYEIDKYAMQVSASNYPDIIQCGNAFKVCEDGWKLA